MVYKWYLLKVKYTLDWTWETYFFGLHRTFFINVHLRAFEGLPRVEFNII